MTADARAWAGTTEDTYDLHRFNENRQAGCHPRIRTHSRITERDESCEPYMTLRTRAQIEGHWAADKFRFCAVCADLSA
ncbi:hypothetical protein [Streptomyces cyaneofuscatus]|uniref:hypothetical protein n=1 Tax=Streptomyces cyaneofuscatus TaxID=66883 RepID=UPI0036634386